MEDRISIDGFEFVRTSIACPEQYNVFLNGVRVGYLRLRHGIFRVDFPDVGGETVYSTHPNADGEFKDNERMYYLKQAVEAIKKRLKTSDERNELEI